MFLSCLLLVYYFALFFGMSSAVGGGGSGGGYWREVRKSNVVGFFAQDLEGTDPGGFDWVGFFSCAIRSAGEGERGGANYGAD